jgi:hypothetical protein
MPGEIRSICPHPSMPLLAVIDHGRRKLAVLRLDGSSVFEAQAPPCRPTPDWISPGYADCLFDVTGAYLWTAARVSEANIQVLVTVQSSAA